MVDPKSSPATAPAVVVPGITLTKMVLRVTGCHAWIARKKDLGYP